MRRFRKILFWCHLPIGVTGGLIILIMSVTGVLLTYERQITAWADTTGYRVASGSQPATRIPLETVIANARAAQSSDPTSVTRRADPLAPVEVAFGREAPLFVDPYSGQVLGSGSQKVRSFFRVVTDWHRWLGAQGDNRPIAKAITGACNLGFLFLVMSGFYLWWPKQLNLRSIKRNIWFKKNLRGPARNFNWHNTIGFWSAVPLFIVVISATVISYTWAGNLVYRLAGENPPAPRVANNQQPNSRPAKTLDTASLKNLDELWAVALTQVNDWRSVSMRMPGASDGRVTFTIDKGNGGQPQHRAQLTLDRQSGGVVNWEPFSTFSRGRQIRSLLRFAHTGEVAGIAGQTIAGLVSAGGAFLVWTGLALSFRRLLAWRSKRATSRRNGRNVQPLFNAPPLAKTVNPDAD